MNNGPKYETGSYTVLLFDRHGTKQDSRKAPNAVEAKRIGETAITAPPHASYVILRVIANSQDNWYPWADPEDATTA